MNKTFTSMLQQPQSAVVSWLKYNHCAEKCNDVTNRRTFCAWEKIRSKRGTSGLMSRVIAAEVERGSINLIKSDVPCN